MNLMMKFSLTFGDGNEVKTLNWKIFCYFQEFFDQPKSEKLSNSLTFVPSLDYHPPSRERLLRG